MKRPDRPERPNRPHGPGRHGGPPHDRNFWGDWNDEWQRRVGEQPNHPPAPDSAEHLGAWRDFFFQFTGEMPEHHWAFGGRRFRPWHQGDVAFNPFVAKMVSQGGGLLPLIVLHLLQEQPRYGNELMTLISQKTGDQLAANPGAVYPLMTELENRGMVEGTWDDPRKRTVRVYHLTPKGESEVKRVKAIVTPKLEEAIEVLQSLVNELNNSNDSNNTNQEQRGDSTI